MKKLILLILVLILFGLSLVFHDEIATSIIDITNIISDKINQNGRKNTKLVNNSYASNNNYKYVSIIDDFTPHNNKELRNIYYTVLNSGMTNFTFYCSKKYKSCVDDIDYISNNQKLLSHVNDYVPVYNSFKNIETEFDSLGKADIKITHTYNDEQIKVINKKIDEIIEKNITDKMSDEDKIKTIHDYIINNTKYDVKRSDEKDTTYHSDTAYGVLIEGYGICGGYSDSMKLFLDRFNIPNFKVASENHVWNAVYVNNKWYHLDLTWDDPINKDGKDILEYNYFLITTEELLNLETEQHTFDTKVFEELA